MATMTGRNQVKHSTIVVERSFKASPVKVFAAWADPVAHGRWAVPGDDDWALAEFEHDFKVGGSNMSFFGLKGAPRYRSIGHYLDIVPNERIVTAEAMHDGERRIMATLYTVEFQKENGGTHLILTDQAASLDGQTHEDRIAGWEEILDRLGVQMKAEGN
jgi:uncharacterized protein YndB with AHSA1/START domain